MAPSGQRRGLEGEPSEEPVEQPPRKYQGFDEDEPPNNPMVDISFCDTL